MSLTTKQKLNSAAQKASAKWWGLSWSNDWPKRGSAGPGSHWWDNCFAYEYKKRWRGK